MTDKELAKQYVEEAPYHPGYEDAIMVETRVDDNVSKRDKSWQDGYNTGYNAAKEHIIEKITTLLWKEKNES